MYIHLSYTLGSNFLLYSFLKHICISILRCRNVYKQNLKKKKTKTRQMFGKFCFQNFGNSEDSWIIEVYSPTSLSTWPFPLRQNKHWGGGLSKKLFLSNNLKVIIHHFSAIDPGPASSIYSVLCFCKPGSWPDWRIQSSTKSSLV